ncbi:MAG: YhbY family RNA-binding protein [Cellvibrionaceae bacterium]|nr:YhbY family RNA-binding protein [Cellvibrionaceae bacterium]
MSLTPAQKKRYRSIGHTLKPIVTIADKGLSENLQAELERALSDHELIKVKLAISDRTLRNQTTQELCTQTNALLVQAIGKTALIFRQAKKPKAKLSNLSRGC